MAKIKKKYQSKERLSLGHSLMNGNLPKPFRDGRINHDKHYMDNSEIEIEKFGLFDASSPNFNQYYPDVNKEDFIPSEGDFVFPKFRALSEVIVRPFAPIDFRKPGVLSESIPLIIGLSIYPNHEMITGDELGAILDGSYMDKPKSIKTSNNVELEIPPGINIIMKLDAKSNPRISRAINMKPPSIHSVSVTVEFEWEQSHEMERDEFWNKLGTYTENGELIRRVATKVIRYHELSLVPHGADPFAQQVDDDGNIALPEYAKASYQFSENSNGITLVTSKDDNLIYFMSFKDTDKLSDTIPNKQLNINNNQHQIVMFEKLKAKLKAKFGDSLTDEQLEEKAIALLEAESNTTALSEENATLKTTNEQLVKDKEKAETEKAETETKLQAAEKISNTALTDMRNEAVRLCQLVNENKADESLLSLIGKSDYEGAKSMVAQFSKLAEERFGKGSIRDEDGQNNGDDSIDPETGGSESFEEAIDAVVKDFSQVKTNKIHAD